MGDSSAQNTEDFNVGDVVWLKSGGPKMTVTEIDEDEVTCVWFEGTQARSDEFIPLALTKVDSSSAGSRDLRRV